MKCFSSRIAALFVALAAILALGASAQAAGPTWTTSVLPSLSGNFSEGMALNEDGVVVGVSQIRDGRYTFGRAVLWSGGSITDLGVLPGYPDSSATDVNNRGQVVGYAEDPLAGPTYRAFLWKRGTMTDLGFSFAAAINNQGVVAGWDEGPSGKPQAVIWRNGVVTPIVVDGATESSATAINERGQVLVEAFTATGEHNLLWEKGKLTEVGTNGGATGINDRGQVVGYGFGADLHDHGFLWTRGMVTDLGVDVYAHAINEPGAIVGSFTSDGAQHGLLWQNGTITDLGDSFVPVDVNNRGDLTGSDTLGHAVLWSRHS